MDGEVSNCKSPLDVLKYKFLSRKDFMHDQSSLNDRLSDSCRHLMVFFIYYCLCIYHSPRWEELQDLDEVEGRASLSWPCHFTV